MAYTYKVEDHFLPGMPQTVLPNGLLSRAIVGHFTVGAPGRAGALGTARFLVDAASRNASYHEIWWWENRTFGVLRLVDNTRASHSMNPNPPDWAPGPNVRRLLGDKVSDPNAWSYSVSFAGALVDLNKAIADPDFIDGCARRTRELIEQEPTLTDKAQPYFTHAEGQPSTRSDWGTVLAGRIYAAMATNPPTFSDVPPSHPNFWDIEWAAKQGLTSGIGGGKYGPDQPVTRAQLATFLRRLATLVKP